MYKRQPVSSATSSHSQQRSARRSPALASVPPHVAQRPGGGNRSGFIGDYHKERIERGARACWHAAALEIIIESRRYSMPVLIRERSAAAVKAFAEMNELFA